MNLETIHPRVIKTIIDELSTLCLGGWNYVGIVVADVSLAAGSLARCVLCFGSWRQQRLRGFQQENAFTRVFGISISVIVLSLRYGFELVLRRGYGLEELLRGRAVIPHSYLPAGIVATMRRVVNYHSSWARQQQVESFDAPDEWFSFVPWRLMHSTCILFLAVISVLLLLSVLGFDPMSLRGLVCSFVVLFSGNPGSTAGRGFNPAGGAPGGG
ncbi:hypothetical protein F511_09355 [Dorcoceras hygrometricum]|uniref:Uncharacterized protein n=1 Tax=Dorcoceras hygrometricum TaxID=472368 RepID=A0A2Z7ALH4_9LAMI|nr:hypothetical protein F511_09355 [Dorcoceras hygrometricum]